MGFLFFLICVLSCLLPGSFCILVLIFVSYPLFSCSVCSVFNLTFVFYVLHFFYSFSLPCLLLSFISSLCLYFLRFFVSLFVWKVRYRYSFPSFALFPFSCLSSNWSAFFSLISLFSSASFCNFLSFREFYMPIHLFLFLIFANLLSCLPGVDS